MKIKDATRRISDGDLCIYYDGTEDFKFRMKVPEEFSDNYHGQVFVRHCIQDH